MRIWLPSLSEMNPDSCLRGLAILLFIGGAMQLSLALIGWMPDMAASPLLFAGGGLMAILAVTLLAYMSSAFRDAQHLELRRPAIAAALISSFHAISLVVALIGFLDGLSAFRSALLASWLLQLGNLCIVTSWLVAMIRRYRVLSPRTK